MLFTTPNSRRIIRRPHWFRVEFDGIQKPPSIQRRIPPVDELEYQQWNGNKFLSLHLIILFVLCFSLILVTVVEQQITVLAFSLFFAAVVVVVAVALRSGLFHSVLCRSLGGVLFCSQLIFNTAIPTILRKIYILFVCWLSFLFSVVFAEQAEWLKHSFDWWTWISLIADSKNIYENYSHKQIFEGDLISRRGFSAACEFFAHFNFLSILTASLRYLSFRKWGISMIFPEMSLVFLASLPMVGVIGSRRESPEWKYTNNHPKWAPRHGNPPAKTHAKIFKIIKIALNFRRAY